MKMSERSELFSFLRKLIELEPMIYIVFNIVIEEQVPGHLHLLP